MSCKTMFSIILLLLYQTILGQYNFDSIQICHHQGMLDKLIIGEYEVKMKNGSLSGITSKEKAVEYEEPNKTLTLTNLIKGSSIKLKLIRNGVLVSTKDTSFLLNKSTSINLAPKDEQEDAYGICSIGDFSFVFEFVNSNIKKIRIPTTGKYVIIGIEQIKGVYIWDIFIESANHVNQVLLTYSINNVLNSLNIHDDKNKVGVRLKYKRKNGVIDLVQGLRVYGNNAFASDTFYKLQYRKAGKLKNKSGFNLSCSSIASLP